MIRGLDQGRTIHVVGAGPAGLSAAITAARSGSRVVVHERASCAGHRFHGDFQGLENWTTYDDVLEQLAAIGIDPSFRHKEFHAVTCFDPKGRAHEFRSDDPFFYLVRRGPDDGTLDDALSKRAADLGVEIRWNDAVSHLPSGGIICQGPHAADAIAVGWLFDTDMADAAFAAVDNSLAPGGYAYLLALGGKGTLATCMFSDFHHEKVYLERTVDFFQSRLRFRMDRARHFGGLGNMRLPLTAVRGLLVFAGESAGFQDPLWGFGMRYALLSGHLAARALLQGQPGSYDELWKERIAGSIQSGIVNRWLYSGFGNKGYEFFVRYMNRSKDPRVSLRRLYAASNWKSLLFPLAQKLVARATTTPACDRPECDCTWCRCVREMQAAKGEVTPPAAGSG